MKLYKLSLLALALAGTMAACSDDDYTAPASTPGVFFPATLTSTVELPTSGNSVTLPVERVGVSGDATYQISSTDESGLFNIPSSVSFAGDQTQSTITITFDADKIENDTPYPATIKLEGATNSWGITDYNVNFIRNTPLEITPLDDYAIYIYNNFISGWDYYEAAKVVDATKPNEIMYTIYNYLDYPEVNDGADLTITIYTDMIFNETCYLCGVGPTVVPNGEALTGTKIVVRDYIDWALEYNDYPAEYRTLFKDEYQSYFDPTTGVFYLKMMYTAPDKGPTSYYGALDYEYVQLPGYPVYDISVKYNGYYTDIYDKFSYAMGELTLGADVAQVQVFNVLGVDVSAALGQALAGELQGGVWVEPDPDAETTPFEILIPNPGTYTLMAISYDKDGQPQDYDYFTYSASGAIASGNWESVGTGKFADGWILATTKDADGVYVNPLKNTWDVEIQKSLDYEGIYRMVQPYMIDDCPLIDYNANEAPTSITFDISDPNFVVVDYQFSGFTTSSGVSYYIADGSYTALYSEMSKEEAIEEGYNSYMEDNEVIIPYPFYTLGQNADALGDRMNPDEYEAVIFMPGADMNKAAANYIRRSVARNYNIRNIVPQLRPSSKGPKSIKLSPAVGDAKAASAAM